MPTEPLFKPISDYDRKCLGPNHMIVRGSAIKKGEAFTFNAWGPEVAARVAVKARPKPAPQPSKFPIADDDYNALTNTDRISRVNAINYNNPWTPRGYLPAFTKRVAIPGK